MARPWSTGVMEYLSVGKEITPLTITPLLQYANAPKLICPDPYIGLYLKKITKKPLTDYFFLL